jgi:ketosteroid isomerase-like protein
MSPEETVEAFFKSFNDGDLGVIVGLYEGQAVLVAQPGQITQGTAALREALNEFLALKPTLIPEKKKLVTAGDIALSVVQWSLRGKGPDGQAVQMNGTTADVLRRQADGSWRFVIDNPWGAGILD